MELSKGITRVTIEGFFDIRSRGPVMGYPWGPRGGPKILKFFFHFFSFFSTGIVLRRSKSLVKVLIGPSYGHFELFGSSKLRISPSGFSEISAFSLTKQFLNMIIIKQRVIYHFLK